MKLERYKSSNKFISFCSQISQRKYLSWKWFCCEEANFVSRCFRNISYPKHFEKQWPDLKLSMASYRIVSYRLFCLVLDCIVFSGVVFCWFLLSRSVLSLFCWFVLTSSVLFLFCFLCFVELCWVGLFPLFFACVALSRFQCLCLSYCVVLVYCCVIFSLRVIGLKDICTPLNCTVLRKTMGSMNNKRWGFSLYTESLVYWFRPNHPGGVTLL